MAISLKRCGMLEPIGGRLVIAVVWRRVRKMQIEEHV